MNAMGLQAAGVLSRMAERRTVTIVTVFLLVVGVALLGSQMGYGSPSCTGKADEVVEVELERQVGKFACGYEGEVVNTEYHKTVYEGDDGCNYIVHDRRVIKHHDTGKVDVYYYARVDEDDTIRGNGTGMGAHCLDGHPNPKHVADYTPVLTDPNITEDAIHLHHDSVLKKVS